MTSTTPDTTKRADIVDAAITEFQMHGFGGARVDEIAVRAQVSKRTLYRYFPSKEDLFDEIVTMALSQHPSEATSIFEPERPFADQLREMVDAYLDIMSAEKYIALARVVTVEFIHQPELARASEKIAPEDRFERFFLSAMQAGAMRTANAKAAMMQLTALLKAFFFWPAFFEDASPFDGETRARLREDCLTMFLNHYVVRK